MMETIEIIFDRDDPGQSLSQLGRMQHQHGSWYPSGTMEWWFIDRKIPLKIDHRWSKETGGLWFFEIPREHALLPKLVWSI